MIKNPGVFALGCALLFPACSEPKKEPPKREEVTPLLQKEAESLQKEGEIVNPTLGVETRWDLASMDVREQAGNEAQPWAGTLNFKIVSKTRDGTSTVTRRFDKSFEYAYDVAMGRWLLK